LAGHRPPAVGHPLVGRPTAKEEAKLIGKKSYEEAKRIEEEAKKKSKEEAKRAKEEAKKKPKEEATKRAKEEAKAARKAEKENEEVTLDLAALNMPKSKGVR
jgi:hypothetical protein